MCLRSRAPFTCLFIGFLVVDYVRLFHSDFRIYKKKPLMIIRS